MGNRLVFIQSESERPTEIMMKGLNEWTRFWWEWRRPWEVSDVSQHRLVWTRWTGVPLQAWTDHFFSLGSSKIGKMVELHDMTKGKKMLDAAYVKIKTGIH